MHFLKCNAPLGVQWSGGGWRCNAPLGVQAAQIASAFHLAPPMPIRLPCAPLDALPGRGKA
jgi:hypothetical protein